MTRPSATLVLEGHIIDSLMLPQLMDMVMDQGGNFDVKELRVGQHKTDPSYCRIEVYAEREAVLDGIVKLARELGARVAQEQPARLVPVPADGVFPEGFYSASNLPTEVLLEDGRWVAVENQEMDTAVTVDTAAGRARCVAFSAVRAGMPVVVGHQGVRVTPLERSRNTEVFSFMTSEVSIEKPKKRLIGEIAQEMKEIRGQGGRILVVGGPAIVHTGSARLLVSLIEAGYVQVLFAGNALATHDIESALFGTSLGIDIEDGLPIEHGHEHHMRAINRVRAAGSIRALVESGGLTGGVMHACVRHGVEVVLAGSIRDDGPLPDVITDVIEAQERMRELIWAGGKEGRSGVRLALMLSTMLHSIATGNLLPADVRTVCVDMNPATVTKLADRGSWQSIGLVTDVDSFLRELAAHLL